ncbi:MAG: hypothetical protein MZV65_39520 [Chromatiales bacterium]|nr:hypothetical protein [Chromatiales bacterium]MCK7581126.1 hypothetical protein [Chromatiales bacterium]
MLRDADVGGDAFADFLRGFLKPTGRSSRHSATGARTKLPEQSVELPHHQAGCDAITERPDQTLIGRSRLGGLIGDGRLGLLGGDAAVDQGAIVRAVLVERFMGLRADVVACLSRSFSSGHAAANRRAGRRAARHQRRGQRRQERSQHAGHLERIPGDRRIGPEIEFALKQIAARCRAGQSLLSCRTDRAQDLVADLLAFLIPLLEQFAPLLAQLFHLGLHHPQHFALARRQLRVILQR